MKRLCLVAVVALVTGALAVAPTAGAVTTQVAYQETLEYSKTACNHDRFCRRYNAGSCRHQNGGVSCWAWNYERKQHRKYTCKRLLLWKGAHGYFLTGWKCGYPGWTWGP